MTPTIKCHGCGADLYDDHAHVEAFRNAALDTDPDAPPLIEKWWCDLCNPEGNTVTARFAREARERYVTQLQRQLDSLGDDKVCLDCGAGLTDPADMYVDPGPPSPGGALPPELWAWRCGDCWAARAAPRINWGAVEAVLDGWAQRHPEGDPR